MNEATFDLLTIRPRCPVRARDSRFLVLFPPSSKSTPASLSDCRNVMKAGQSRAGATFHARLRCADAAKRIHGIQILRMLQENTFVKRTHVPGSSFCWWGGLGGWGVLRLMLGWNSAQGLCVPADAIRVSGAPHTSTGESLCKERRCLETKPSIFMPERPEEGSGLAPTARTPTCVRSHGNTSLQPQGKKFPG